MVQELFDQPGGQFRIRPRFGRTLIAIKRRTGAAADAPIVTNVSPNADEEIRRDDVLVLLGSNERLGKLDTMFT